MQETNTDVALPQDELRKQRRVVYAFVGVAAAYFLPTAPIYALVFHQPGMAYFQVAAGALCLLLVGYFRLTHQKQVVMLSASALATLTVIIMALFRTPPDGATYGVFGASVFLFFLLERKYYLFFVACITAAVGSAFGLSLAGEKVLPYSTVEYGILLLSLVADNSLLVLYGREKTKVDRKLNRSLKEIRKLAHQLESENERIEAEVKQRTEEYKREHAKLETSIESIHLGFVLLDQNDAVVSVNKAGKQILRFGGDKPDTAAVPMASAADIGIAFGEAYAFVQHLNAANQSKRTVAGHDVHFGGHYVSITITPVLEGGQVVGTVVLLEDTTDSKALERSRDEFFSIASHELRTPLTSIVGNATMAQQYYDQLDKPQVMELLNDVTSAGKHLITIVNDFLDMSRLEQGKIVIDTQTVAVQQAVDEALGEVKKLAEEKNLTLKFSSPGKPMSVAADAGRLRQILVNLLSNAIKYTDDGSVSVEASKVGDMVQIAITDTGKGIHEEAQYLLFRKFQQASDNILTRDNSQSTGLGLYISKMIAKAMKGDVYLEKSAPNQGSKFVLTLPTSTT